MTKPDNLLSRARLRFSEVFGIEPLSEKFGEARRALAGDASTPKSKFGVSSLKFFKPRWSAYLWLGGREATRRVPIYNFYNHLQPPAREGWSVRVTRVSDFRARAFTYDSHNGTDFAVAPGTTVVAPAAGRVLRVSSEFDRGGLKVFIDHGEGLMTTSNHLARSLVRAGQFVHRGEPIALSGYSGIDGLLTFPLGTPHVHFNVWLNGQYVDPFARDGETSLWRTGNRPTPASASEVTASRADAPGFGTEFAASALQNCLDDCQDSATNAAILAAPAGDERAMAALFYQNYYPTKFSKRTELLACAFERAPRLDLPFAAADFEGVVFPDEPVRFTLGSRTRA